MERGYIGDWFHCLESGQAMIAVYEAYRGGKLQGIQVSYGYTEWPSHSIYVVLENNT